MKSMEQYQFEDFLPHGESELFAKIDSFDTFVKAYGEEYLASLGAQLLGPAAHQTRMREVDGEEHNVIMLGSNSYLELTTHPRVVAASKAACDRYGYGMGAVSLYAGMTDLHKELEARIAAFYGEEEAMLIPCGYSANVGIISALCGPGDVVINDAFNHASIFDGCRLSGADVKVYLHRNMNHLEKVLRQLPSDKAGRLIITDGVFSMDGDLAPLREILALAQKYGARVMVDDAHGLGIVGATGRGTAEACGCASQIDVSMGTLSKTPGAIGGYCVGSAKLIQYLRYYTRTFFFSTSLPAPVVAGLIEVFRLLADDAAGRGQLWENITFLRQGLQALGFNTGATASAIIPIIVGDERKLVRFNNDLRRMGVYTNIVTYPAVRRKDCRLRLCVMSTLTSAEMKQALAIIGELGRQHDII